MDLAVLVVHGMGTQEEDFSAPLVEGVSSALRGRGLDPARVAWQPLWWADLLAPRQRAYLDAADASHRLDWGGLREFVVAALGDAAAYQYVGEPTSTYRRIHDRIRSRVHELWVDHLDRTPVPTVVVAHSLGSHVASSYVWDAQRGLPTGAGDDAVPFERFGHLAGMVTLGSPIPLFTFAHDPVLPIEFPGPQLPAAVASRARWLNVFDRDDVLGWPLRPLGPAYADVVDEDVQVDVGTIGLSATPLSHRGYWTDGDVAERIADLLADLLAA